MEKRVSSSLTRALQCSKTVDEGCWNSRTGGVPVSSTYERQEPAHLPSHIVVRKQLPLLGY